MTLLKLVKKHWFRIWWVIAIGLEGQMTRSQVIQRSQLIYKNFKKSPAMALDNIVYTGDAGIAITEGS